MTRANRYIAWACNEKVRNWECSSTIFAVGSVLYTQQVRMCQVTVANAFKFVCRIVFSVERPQPSDVRRHKRSKVSTGKTTADSKMVQIAKGAVFTVGYVVSTTELQEWRFQSHHMIRCTFSTSKSALHVVQGAVIFKMSEWVSECAQEFCKRS